MDWILFYIITDLLFTCYAISEATTNCVSAGPVVPDDRNMLNENLWSPDRPTIQGKHVPGKLQTQKYKTWIVSYK